MKFFNKIILLLAAFSVLLSCTYRPDADTRVKIRRDLYNPNLTQNELSPYRGQTMLFYSIVIDAKNIDNFSYYSPNRDVGYMLYYSPSSMQQPLASFLWYALQKGFDSAGITVKESGPIKNVPELLISLTSLTDQEAQMRVSLMRNGVLLAQKDLVITMSYAPTKDVSELEKTAYLFMDKIAFSILTDADIKRAFFSDKAKI
jgi:hypothetical protein